MGKFRSLFFSLFILLYLIFVPVTFAADKDFSSSHEVSYDVGLDGITLVTQKVTLKNLTSQYYVSSYTLSIGSTSITEASATDDTGNLETNVKTEAGKSSVTVKFPSQVTGVGKTQTFTLKFKTPDFTTHLGKVWEISLPKVPQSDNIESYNLTLSVPTLFGDPTLIYPKPNKESQTVDRLYYIYNKDSILSQGVSVSFGTNQIFDFDLSYNLDNPSLFPIMTSVTLPPDTNFQDVILTHLSPEPINVTMDGDGNYLAWYKLNRKSSQNVRVSGSAKLYIKSKDRKPTKLTDKEVSEYTKTDKYWEVNNPKLQSTLEEIFKDTDPKTNKEKAQLIYRYVVNTLTYDTKKVDQNNIERLGAVTALNNPSLAVCMEFTDLFVALARQAGIPARELDGYAYSRNKSLRPLSLGKDLLHAWPEYYDSNLGWVMVDPTWENTSGGVDFFNKFDLNHFVLAIKGYSSQSPYVSDDVKVEISQNEFVQKPMVGINIESSERVIAGVPTELKISVLNLGNTTLGPSVLSIGSQKLDLGNKDPISLGSIPAFGHTEYSLSLKSPFSAQAFEDTIVVLVKSLAGEIPFSQTQTKNISVQPFFLFQAFPFILILLLIVILGVYLLVFLTHLKIKKKLFFRRNK